MTMGTARFRFEYRLLGWAEGLSRQLNGDLRGTFVGLRDNGAVRRVYFAPAGEAFEGPRKVSLAETYPRWFLYQPGADVGSGYLEWFGVQRPVAERWLGQLLGRDDFVDVRADGAREWPDAWRVRVR